MILYQCIISGDEMFTDTYNIEEKDGFYVLKGKFVTKKADDVDASLLGANPSAEEAADDVEGSVESGVDVIINNRLKETGFGAKKDYQVYMKEYMKTVFAKLASKMSTEDVAKAKSEATEAFKQAVSKFKDWQYYTGESQNPDGHVALIEWLDEKIDGKDVQTPYCYFYKAGMEQIKC